MIVKEDEELFEVLNLLKEPEQAYAKELIAQGYTLEDQSLTPKAERFVRQFMESKMKLLYDAVKEKVNYTRDKGYVLYKAGLKNPLAAEMILEELVKQKKLKKKDSDDYIVRCGVNH